MRALPNRMPAVRRPDRGNEWWVDFRFCGRRLRRRSPVQTKLGAKRFEDMLRAEMLSARVTPKALPIVTFSEFAPRWIDKYVKPQNRPATLRAKISALKCWIVPELGSLNLSEITTSRVDEFIASMTERGLQPKTVNNKLTFLRNALMTAQEWGLLETLPLFRWLEVKNEGYRYLVPDEAQALLAAADPGQWRTLILFCLHTGARYGEAAALRWSDLDLDADEPKVCIRRSAGRNEIGPRKTNEPNTVPLTGELVAALRALRHERPYVFNPNGQGPLPYSTAYDNLQRITGAAGLAKHGWHAHRHTLGTELTAQGVPLSVTKEILGHTDVRTTERYIHVATATKLAALKRLGYARAVESSSRLMVTTDPARIAVAAPASGISAP